MQIIHSIQELTDALSWRRQAKSVGLVVTKGHLHRAHSTLVETSQACCDMTVVTTFAGQHLAPAQSEQDHSAGHQGGDPSADQALLERLGVDVLFAPAASELYPAEPGRRTRVSLPKIDCKALSGAERGACQETVTLALKLCNIVLPTTLIVGEKHYQQLHLIERALNDLNHPTRVRRVAAIREADGLLATAQQQQVPAADRARAPLLYQTLQDIGHALKSGARHFDKLEQTARIALRGGGFRTEYVAICDEETMLEPTATTRAFRILGAAALGTVRIVDNVRVQT